MVVVGVPNEPNTLQFLFPGNVECVSALAQSIDESTESHFGFGVNVVFGHEQVSMDALVFFQEFYFGGPGNDFVPRPHKS